VAGHEYETGVWRISDITKRIIPPLALLFCLALMGYDGVDGVEWKVNFSTAHQYNQIPCQRSLCQWSCDCSHRGSTGGACLPFS